MWMTSWRANKKRERESGTVGVLESPVLGSGLALLGWGLGSGHLIAVEVSSLVCSRRWGYSQRLVQEERRA